MEKHCWNQCFEFVGFKDWIQEVKEKFSEKNKIIANEILKEIETRLQFLLDVGLDYLSLSRSSRTLSGGESQRIRLATQIGSPTRKCIVYFRWTEHWFASKRQRKTHQFIENLRDIGNSVLVVEHDKDMILEADYVLDIGPRAGKHGGEILWQGKPKDLIKANTITADYLTGKRSIEIPKERRKGNGKFLKLKGCNRK